MNNWEEITDYCPYCGEPISLLIDCSDLSQKYIEDCEVCCRPITVNIVITPDGAIDCTLKDENST
ncbi:MAG: CPXCG motif-containing cysteine-rich protein [Gammaproteobacteria bacterium]|nr:CPXCG motif-containing cysteine-rich protein [Gammaproteobacteria bacterium]